MPNLYDLERIRELEMAEIERRCAWGHRLERRPRTGLRQFVAARLIALAERLAPAMTTPAGTADAYQATGMPVGQG